MSKRASDVLNEHLRMIYVFSKPSAAARLMSSHERRQGSGEWGREGGRCGWGVGWRGGGGLSPGRPRPVSTRHVATDWRRHAPPLMTRDIAVITRDVAVTKPPFAKWTRHGNRDSPKFALDGISSSSTRNARRDERRLRFLSTGRRHYGLSTRRRTLIRRLTDRSLLVMGEAR